MKLIESLKENAKNQIREYIGPQKKKTSLSLRGEQKKQLERVSKLVGLNPESSRKLTLSFKNNINSKNVKHDNEKSDDFEILLSDNKSDFYKNYYAKRDEENDEDNDFFSFKKKDEKLINNLDIEDVVKYFKHKGVVGEEKLAINIFLAASNNMSFGVEGYSGSGKTFVVDKLIELFNPDELYQLDLSSKMAVFYDSKKINGFKTIYIPELQKALQETKSPIVEVVKNLTEGKDVKRIVTDSKKKGNKTYKINKGKSIIYTLASENYFKKDEELNRRFLRFKTNNSESHLENIMNYKSSKRQDFLMFEEQDFNEEKLKTCFNYLRNLDMNIFDPYSLFISDFLPKTQKSIGYVDHYFSLVDATTKFNNEKRFSFNYNNKKVLVSDIEDHFLIHKIYYNEFMNTLKEFSERNNMEEEIEVINSLEKKKY